MWSYGFAMRTGRALAALIALTVSTWFAVAAEASATQYGYLSGFNSGEISAGKLLPDGGFDPVTGSPFAPGAARLQGIAVSPDGKLVFAADEDDDEVEALAVGSNGALSDAPGSPRPVGDQPVGVAPTPNGKFVYVSGGDAIAGFKVGAGGAISPTFQASIDNPEGPQGIAISADGKRLFTANGNSNVSSYRIAKDGTLTEVSGSPFGSLFIPYALVVSRDGKHLYVADREQPTSAVHGFTVGSNGSLTELDDSPWSTGGGNAFSLALSPDGDYVYAGNYESDSLAAFHVMPDATLTPLAGSPYPATDSPSAITFDAAGEHLFLNGGSGPLQTWSIGSGGVPDSPLLNLFGEAGDFQSIALTPAQPPKAKLKAKRNGLKVKFDASKSTDDGPIAQYDWKFGDGGKTTTQKPRATWRYEKKGRYEVSVRATDRDRCSTKYRSGGQTPYCNGGKQAVATKTVKVR